MEGYCPVCKCLVEAIGNGQCVHCFNHVMKPEYDPQNLVQRTFVPTGKNVWRADK